MSLRQGHNVTYSQYRELDLSPMETPSKQHLMKLMLSLNIGLCGSLSECMTDVAFFPHWFHKVYLLYQCQLQMANCNLQLICRRSLTLFRNVYTKFSKRIIKLTFICIKSNWIHCWFYHFIKALLSAQSTQNS